MAIARLTATLFILALSFHQAVLAAEGVDEQALKDAEEAQAEHEAAPEPVASQVVESAPEVELAAGDGDIDTTGTYRRPNETKPNQTRVEPGFLMMLCTIGVIGWIGLPENPKYFS